MMEKPLAVNLEHARAMAAAARKGGIHLLVNYETPWYPANQAAYRLIWEQNTIGEMRKFVVHDGHRGPKEIGCPPEFLAWLTDPVLNGGGALTDFGCYGANLFTWLMADAPPVSVMAVAQDLQAAVVPLVGGPATVRGEWPGAVGVLHATLELAL